MPKPVIWSPQSENDFSTIIDYLIEHWDKVVAAKFIDVIETFIHQISIYPNNIRLSGNLRKLENV